MLAAVTVDVLKGTCVWVEMDREGLFTAIDKLEKLVCEKEFSGWNICRFDVLEHSIV